MPSFVGPDSIKFNGSESLPSGLDCPFLDASGESATVLPDAIQPAFGKRLVFIGEIGGRDQLRDALALALGRSVPDGFYEIKRVEK